ncbi:MAG: DUF433 domain-containing protein [Bacteroidia bacterium]
MIGFDRITFDKNMMQGKACIRNMRIPVSLILNLLANGMNEEHIIQEYPSLVHEDILECLKYAAWLATEEVYAS